MERTIDKVYIRLCVTGDERFILSFFFLSFVRSFVLSRLFIRILAASSRNALYLFSVSRMIKFIDKRSSARARRLARANLFRAPSSLEFDIVV